MPDFGSKHFSTCGFKNAKIDTSKLIACGHSFGAITALSLQKADKRVKGAIGCDTWFFPVYHALQSGDFGI